MLFLGTYLRSSTQMQQAMKVMSRRASNAATITGQTTGLRVLAILHTKPLASSLLMSLLGNSGGTEHEHSKISSRRCYVKTYLFGRWYAPDVHRLRSARSVMTSVIFNQINLIFYSALRSQLQERWTRLWTTCSGSLLGNAVVGSQIYRISLFVC